MARESLPAFLSDPEAPRMKTLHWISITSKSSFSTPLSAGSTSSPSPTMWTLNKRVCAPENTPNFPCPALCHPAFTQARLSAWNAILLFLWTNIFFSFSSSEALFLALSWHLYIFLPRAENDESISESTAWVFLISVPLPSPAHRRGSRNWGEEI